MKTFLHLTICILIGMAGPVSAQQDSTAQPFELFDIERRPEFPGGEAALMQFLAQNLRYPKLALENMVQGTVVVSFVIDKAGAVTDPVILKDIGAGCGAEAIRVINSMPTWTPGQANGHPVKVKYSLPLRFKVGMGLEEPNLGNLVPADLSTKYSEAQVWDILRKQAENTGLKGAIKPEAPFSVAGRADALFIKNMENVFATRLRKKDIDAFISLKSVSTHFFQIQYAPEFYLGPKYSGRFARFLTSRRDFDMYAEGLGIIGSLKIPKGFKVILYSKKKFKGKKLSIDASNGPVDIPDLSADLSGIPFLTIEDPDFNWMYNTQSVQIILPKPFPPKGE